MKICWDQDAEIRPSFAEIVKKLRTLSAIHPIYSSNEIDILLNNLLFLFLLLLLILFLTLIIWCFKSTNGHSFLRFYCKLFYFILSFIYLLFVIFNLFFYRLSIILPAFGKINQTKCSKQSV